MPVFCGKIMVKSPKKGKSMRTEKANAKINAYLNITSRLANGYHSIVSIMQTVSLCDLVSVELVPAAQTKIALAVSGSTELPTDSRNLAWRAAECFLQHTHLTAEVQINLQKHIPVAAGLAGGSADAAAVLRALNHLCGKPFTTEELSQIGSELGADVPFCVCGGAMLATGVGEVLERVPAMPSCTLVVAIGEDRISTPKAYAALDEKHNFFDHPREQGADVQELIDLWQNDALAASCACFYNVFEDVIPEDNTDVDTIKRLMRQSGALCAMMSGSGPAVFGVFETPEEAEKTSAILQEKGFQSFVCHPSGQYIE